jgi:hypothetical protein
MGLGSGIRDQGSGIWKKPILDPGSGSRVQKGTGSQIPDPDPQHCSVQYNINVKCTVCDNAVQDSVVRYSHGLVEDSV